MSLLASFSKLHEKFKLLYIVKINILVNVGIAMDFIIKRTYFYYTDHKTTVKFLVNCHLVLTSDIN
jgi:hypothetical protein